MTTSRPRLRPGIAVRVGAASWLTLAIAVALAACGEESKQNGGQAAETTQERPVLAKYDGPEAMLPDAYPVPQGKASRPLTYGFMAVADNETTATMVEASRAQANKLGVKLLVKYDRVDVDRQVTNFDQLLNQGANALSVYPIDPRAIRPVIRKARQRDVAVLATDVVRAGEELPEGITSTILFNRDQSAFLQVQEMARLHPGGKIVVVGLAVPVPALQYYIDRVKYWAKRAGLTVVGQQDNAKDDVTGGQEAMTALLGKHPDIDGVIAYNDPSALGASAAARTAGRKISAIGLNGGSDGRAGVEAGRLAATVQVPAPAIAVNFINGAVAVETNPNEKLPPIIQIPPVLVTKENIGRVPSWHEQIEQIRSEPGFAAP